MRLTLARKAPREEQVDWLPGALRDRDKGRRAPTGGLRIRRLRSAGIMHYPHTSMSAPDDQDFELNALGGNMRSVDDDDDFELNSINELILAARDRMGQFRGFDCVASFVHNDVLVETFPDCYEALFVSGATLAAEIVSALQRSGRVGDLARIVLEGAANSDNLAAKTLATKIINKIDSEQHRGPPFRKPVYYVTKTERGLAVVIAIDDRFWNDEWLRDP
jgi:hypothetical protein